MLLILTLTVPLVILTASDLLEDGEGEGEGEDEGRTP